MNRIFCPVFVAALIVMPLALAGCKGRVAKTESETPIAEEQIYVTPVEEMSPVTEPAQTVAAEAIPPTAAPQIAMKEKRATQAADERNKDIQRALKKAGFYAGAIDGKIGPKTKRAIEEFQEEKGLKADGKVGPKTWAELEKYLVR